MSRDLARRGASVLVAAAVLGGGLALGGGTASAQETEPGGSFVEVVVGAIVYPLTNAGIIYPGSLETNSAAVGSSGEPCHGVSDNPEPDGPGCFGVIRVLPDEFFES
ncbi:hypothetical protein ACWDUM_09760 [Rhodococcus sp. NPDC003322]